MADQAAEVASHWAIEPAVKICHDFPEKPLHRSNHRGGLGRIVPEQRALRNACGARNFQSGQPAEAVIHYARDGGIEQLLLGFVAAFCLRAGHGAV